MELGTNLMLKTQIVSSILFCCRLCLKYFADQILNQGPKKKKLLSDEAVSILKNSLSYEYELYEFLQQRLTYQANLHNIRIKNK